MITTHVVERCLLMAALTAFSIACKPRINNSLAAESDAVSPVTFLEEDLPPQTTHSLFDSIFSNGQGAYQIPNSFPKIIEKISRSGDIEPSSILVPHGRSLQKNVAAPNHFRFPRVLTGFISKPKSIAHGKIYLGFNEKADAAEIISANLELGRFEFQIITNVSKDPKVFYAPRSKCLPCHQSGSPIFPEEDWHETNSVSNDRDHHKMIAKLMDIFETQDPSYRYQGVTLNADAQSGSTD